MPLYEYRCSACQTKFTLLIGVVAKPDDEVCPSCGSKEIRRLVSRFRRGRSEDTRIDEIADNLEHRSDPETSAEMRGLMRELGKAMDDDLSDEMEEMFETDMENPGDSE
ncbi:MAG: zinc ribbon domain-containing protein [Fimbriimonadaceae bacterium]|nr:zinc ribbon domain-containing protein [Fimbriimonadaceae bacterium]